MGHKTRIMYIESKADGLEGPARIGRVSFSKTGATIYYRGKEFRSLKGPASKRTITKSRVATSIGSPAHVGMGKIGFTAAIRASKSMKM